MLQDMASVGQKREAPSLLEEDVGQPVRSLDSSQNDTQLGLHTPKSCRLIKEVCL